MRIVLIILCITYSTFGWCQAPTIFTVNGEIEADKLGFTLSHEHVMSNFGGKPSKVSKYDTIALMQQVVPYLRRLKLMGVESIFDGTTAYFGRNVTLLKEISDSTGIQIITNTGFYGAADDRYVPDFAFHVTADSIAKIWISEFRNGIDATTIRPGYIKLAFDNGKPSKIDLKLFEAGVITHLNTGLTLAVHTGNNLHVVHRQLAILKKYRVSPEALIWIHANKADHLDALLDMAKLGTWISLDGVKNTNINEYVERITYFKEHDMLHKVLLSHDGNSFPKGGAIREYQAISEKLLPKLREAGYTDAEIYSLMVTNPKNAFAIHVRKL